MLCLCREDANILSCIPSTNIFIEAGVEAGGVLVHCFGGRSRSAAFIAAYLMCNCGWSYDKALTVIVGGRPVACVNKGFEKQLRAYAITNYDVYATQQVLLRDRIKALHGIRGQNTSHGANGSGYPARSWKESAKGGNKRSWGERDSLSGKGTMMLQAKERERGKELDERVEHDRSSGDEDDENEELAPEEG